MARKRCPRCGQLRSEISLSRRLQDLRYLPKSTKNSVLFVCRIVLGAALLVQIYLGL
jgi:hypothetical protein